MHADYLEIFQLVSLFLDFSQKWLDRTSIYIRLALQNGHNNILINPQPRNNMHNILTALQNFQQSPNHLTIQMHSRLIIRIQNGDNFPDGKFIKFFDDFLLEDVFDIVMEFFEEGFLAFLEEAVGEFGELAEFFGLVD